MGDHPVFAMRFSKIHTAYVQKAERKGRSREEVDAVICWLTGYSQNQLDIQNESGCDTRTFFDDAPKLNPNAHLVKGVVCGVRVEAVEDPLMRKIRILDKLIDELAKGRPMQKILRTSD